MNVYENTRRETHEERMARWGCCLSSCVVVVREVPCTSGVLVIQWCETHQREYR